MEDKNRWSKEEKSLLMSNKDLEGDVSRSKEQIEICNRRVIEVEDAYADLKEALNES